MYLILTLIIFIISILFMNYNQENFTNRFYRKFRYIPRWAYIPVSYPYYNPFVTNYPNYYSYPFYQRYWKPYFRRPYYR